VPQLGALLPIVGIALLFWLLIIRPASRRQKELSRMQSSLDVGDEVMLTSGIFAVLTSIEDDNNLNVTIAEGVTIKVARGAIASVVRREPAEEPADDELAADEPEEN
jgi:preprotein translocase subunit YajC